MSALLGIRRPNGRVGVRERLLVLPSVGCVNRVCELVGARLQDVTVITHQHGCAQLGDDLALTAETLAAIASHPNVTASVIVGLGCESNQPQLLANRVRQRGGVVRLVLLQEQGGIPQTVEAAVEILDELGGALGAERVPLLAGDLCVAILVDATSGALDRRIAERIGAGLEAIGVRALVMENATGSGDRHLEFVEGGVPHAWRGSMTRKPDALETLVQAEWEIPRSVNAGGHDVEKLTAAAALGAQILVFVTPRLSPIGSPVAPTIKVGTGSGPFGRTADMFDICVRSIDQADAVVPLVTEVAAGRKPIAEREGQRDFAIWRTGPTL